MGLRRCRVEGQGETPAIGGIVRVASASRRCKDGFAGRKGTVFTGKVPVPPFSQVPAGEKSEKLC